MKYGKNCQCRILYPAKIFFMNENCTQYFQVNKATDSVNNREYDRMKFRHKKNDPRARSVIQMEEKRSDK